ncbi:MAG: hypothetical protein GC129_02865 [Proteobacteria bacterium]|nr:hypothetical protein [Pseudomonadota bacterium]
MSASLALTPEQRQKLALAYLPRTIFALIFTMLVVAGAAFTFWWAPAYSAPALFTATALALIILVPFSWRLSTIHRGTYGRNAPEAEYLAQRGITVS